MEAIDFTQAYKKALGAGENPNTNDLKYCRAISADAPGRVFLVSAWQPSPAELEIIKAGGLIYIGVMASPQYPTQPPICVMGANPFTEFANPFTWIPEGEPIPVPSGIWSPDNLPPGVEINDNFFKESNEAQVDKIIQGADATIAEARADMYIVKDQEREQKLDGQLVNALTEAAIRAIVKEGKDPYNSLDLVDQGVTKHEIDIVVEKMADETRPPDFDKGAHNFTNPFNATDAI